MFQVQIKGPYILQDQQDIPNESPLGPSGETNMLPGCRSPCRKP